MVEHHGGSLRWNLKARWLHWRWSRALDRAEAWKAEADIRRDAFYRHAKPHTKG